MIIKEDSILPDSVVVFNDVAAFDIAIKNQLDTIDISKILMYLIDQVDAAAIPTLAEQFDVLGFKGLRLANNEQEQRAIIKKAIELHRYKGTLYGVKEAMKAVGFADAVIVEHVNGHWANFTVNLLNEGVGITATTIANLIRMIEEYKNTRSNLVKINMDLLVNDTIEFDDDGDMVEDWISDDNLVFSNKLFYDGTGIYNGTNDHSGDNDVVIWV